MEEGAWEIISDIFDREFLARQAVGGTMPLKSWVSILRSIRFL
jgi:hypothetical protein